jgi:hypothetical protein
VSGPRKKVSKRRVVFTTVGPPARVYSPRPTAERHVVPRWFQPLRFIKVKNRFQFFLFSNAATCAATPRTRWTT